MSGSIQAYGSVSGLAFSPDGKTLAAAAYGVDLLSVTNAERISTAKGHDAWVNEVAFSPDGDTVASVGFNDGTLFAENIETHLESYSFTDTVRLIYFLPSDRTAKSDIDSKIDGWIKAVQTFFADEMEDHGYGRKTFTFEADDSGNAVVHHITGDYANSYYNNNNKWKVWDEIRAAGFEPTRNIYAAFMDLSEKLDGLHCGTGGHWDHGGVVNLVTLSTCLDGDYGKALAVHEFGHAFGLPHDYRNNSDRSIDLGVEDDPLVSSAGATKWLDAHRYFNSVTTFSNQATTVSLSSTTISDSSVTFNFSISDSDGLHQALLLSPYLHENFFSGRNYMVDKNYLDKEIDDWESLSGSSVTAEFTASTLTSDDDTIFLRLIDVNGNIAELEFSVDLSSLSGNAPSLTIHSVDVNSDGIFNIRDLVAVSTNFGQQGPNRADVNGDGTVDIIDLVLSASVLGQDAAASFAWYRDPESIFTHTEVQQWLREARQINLTDPAFQRGILVLEQLLTALTPKETALLPNYPNPFNPETWIPYQLAKPADVSISIYAADGKLVRTLELGDQSVGIYESRSRAAYWDGRNELGESIASGVYFYTLTAGDFAATRKMLIRK